MCRHRVLGRSMRSHSEGFAQQSEQRASPLFEGFADKMCEWCCGRDRCCGPILCRMAAGYAQCQLDNRLKACCAGLTQGALHDRIVALALVQTPGILHYAQNKELSSLSTSRPFDLCSNDEPKNSLSQPPGLCASPSGWGDAEGGQFYRVSSQTRSPEPRHWRLLHDGL